MSSPRASQLPARQLGPKILHGRPETAALKFVCRGTEEAPGRGSLQGSHAIQLAQHLPQRLTVLELSFCLCGITADTCSRLEISCDCLSVLKLFAFLPTAQIQQTLLLYQGRCGRLGSSPTAASFTAEAGPGKLRHRRPWRSLAAVPTWL